MWIKQRDLSQPVVLTIFIEPFVLPLIMSLMIGIGQYQISSLLSAPKDINLIDRSMGQLNQKSISFNIVRKTINRKQMLHSSTSPLATKQKASPLETVATLPEQKKEKHRFQPIILKAAERYQVDPAIIKAIILAESSFNPKAVSRKGARGLMQLMPRTAKYLGVKDSFNPLHNIDGGVRYFKALLDRYDCDVELALAAYNAGSRNVRKYGGVPPFKATKFYIAKVLKYYEVYKIDSKNLPSKSY